MNIEDISDVIFTQTTSSERNQEVNFKFIYNNYVENETIIEDKFIKDRDVESKNRFVRIEFENKSEIGFFTNIENLYSEIRQNILLPLEDKEIYESEREFFNKQDDLSPARKSLVLDNKIEDFSKFMNFYSSSDANISEDSFKFFDKSTLISINNKEEYKNKFLSKEYPEVFNYNNLEGYNDIVNSERIQEKRNKEDYIENFKSGELLPNLNHISESINTGDINRYASLNAVYCGIYIEKFIKEENEYKFLCGKFYTRKQEKSNDVVSKIEDEAIKYGKTYRYVCYNTYFYTTVNPESRFILRHYLLCSHPYISNDIMCKEFSRPPCPVSFNAKYDMQNKKMILTWEEPTNYEGDVKGYQILKRYNIEEPFTVVKQLEGHLPTDLFEEKELILPNDIIKTPGNIKKIFFDESFDPNRMCIYTIRSIDAHGMKSDYSDQIGVYYDFLRNKLIVSLVARSGSRVDYPNEKLLNKSIFHENIADFVDNLPVFEKPKKISLYLTPDFVYIKDEETLHKTLGDKYQFTLTNLNDFVYKTNKFSIVNFE